MIFAQALGEYAATAALAEGLSDLSIRLGGTITEWRVETIVVVVAVAFLWKVLTAAR